MVLGLGDLIAIQHGSGRLLGEGQGDKRSTEADHQGPDQEFLAEHSPHIDPERGEHHVDQDVHRDR